MKQLLKTAQDVILAEKEGLAELARSLDDTFLNALELLRGCEGRVIFSGMGKSGHIGSKLAATMASTGTPALFVHPGEASHGDMGMIKPSDVLILMSNSGNTDELKDLIAYGRRQKLSIIGISKTDDSIVGRASDVFIRLPQVDEACTLQLAPTTSTTMMLALGDALCVALMEIKGFKPSDFHQFHPGGKLGLDLIQVHELMRPLSKVPTCTLPCSMAKVITSINRGGIGLVALTENGVLAGLITDGDIRRNSSLRLIDQDPSDIMSVDPHGVLPTDLASHALKLMNDEGITALVVRDNQSDLTGLLHIHDLLRAGLG